MRSSPLDTQTISMGRGGLRFSLSLSAMSHLRFYRAILSRDKVAASSESLEAMFVCRTLRQSRSVQLWSRTLRLCRASESRDKIAR